MKKFLIAISFLCMFLLTGCGNNETAENDKLPNSSENQEQVVLENDENSGDIENTETQQDEIEQYKFGESYYLDFDNLEYPDDANIIKYNKVMTNMPYTFESDNTQFTLSLDKILSLNGKAIAQPNYPNGEQVIEIIDDLYNSKGDYSIGVIDFDENDNYKEMIIQMHSGIHQDYYIYRVEKDGLVEIFHGGEAYDVDDNTYGLFNLNDKWIFCRVFVPYSNLNFIEGYYLYENGEFKYVERLLTGEKTTDEDGNFAERIQEIVFDITKGADGIWFEHPEYGRVRPRFNLISCKMESEYNYRYTIKLVEDTSAYNVEVAKRIVLPAGTVLEDVELFSHF